MSEKVRPFWEAFPKELQYICTFAFFFVLRLSWWMLFSSWSVGFLQPEVLKCFYSATRMSLPEQVQKELSRNKRLQWSTKELYDSFWNGKQTHFSQLCEKTTTIVTPCHLGSFWLFLSRPRRLTVRSKIDSVCEDIQYWMELLLMVQQLSRVDFRACSSTGKGPGKENKKNNLASFFEPKHPISIQWSGSDYFSMPRILERRGSRVATRSACSRNWATGLEDINLPHFINHLLSMIHVHGIEPFRPRHSIERVNGKASLIHNFSLNSVFVSPLQIGFKEFKGFKSLIQFNPWSFTPLQPWRHRVLQVQEASCEAKCRKWVFQILPGDLVTWSWDDRKGREDPERFVG